MTYSITSGNVGKMFEVVPETGEVKVRGQLDFEKGPKVNSELFYINFRVFSCLFLKFCIKHFHETPHQVYKLTYRVFDEKFAKTTMVVISVVDVNDNPPQFEKGLYTVDNVTEEDQSLSINNPLHLVTVFVISLCHY